jgi:hypothetical protein
MKLFFGVPDEEYIEYLLKEMNGKNYGLITISLVLLNKRINSG